MVGGVCHQRRLESRGTEAVPNAGDTGAGLQLSHYEKDVKSAPKIFLIFGTRKAQARI